MKIKYIILTLFMLLTGCDSSNISDLPIIEYPIYDIEIKELNIQTSLETESHKDEYKNIEYEYGHSHLEEDEYKKCKSKTCPYYHYVVTEKYHDFKLNLKFNNSKKEKIEAIKFHVSNYKTIKIGLLISSDIMGDNVAHSGDFISYYSDGDIIMDVSSFDLKKEYSLRIFVDNYPNDEITLEIKDVKINGYWNESEFEYNNVIKIIEKDVNTEIITDEKNIYEFKFITPENLTMTSLKYYPDEERIGVTFYEYNTTTKVYTMYEPGYFIMMYWFDIGDTRINCFKKETIKIKDDGREVNSTKNK